MRSATSALCKLHSWWVSEGGGGDGDGDGGDGGDDEKTAGPRLLHHADWVAYLLHGEMAGVPSLVYFTSTTLKPAP